MFHSDSLLSQAPLARGSHALPSVLFSVHLALFVGRMTQLQSRKLLVKVANFDEKSIQVFERVSQPLKFYSNFFVWSYTYKWTLALIT